MWTGVGPPATPPTADGLAEGLANLRPLLIVSQQLQRARILGRKRSKPLGDILAPLERADQRRTADDVYDVLQAGIISGRLPPGSFLPQIEVARVLNVSRTPVREAMRKLEEAGLLICEPNNRTRVVTLDPIDIESVYVKLIVLEAVAIILTSNAMTSPLKRQMYGLLDALDDSTARREQETWLAEVGELQDLVVSMAEEPLFSEIRGLRRRIVRYQLTGNGMQRLAPWILRSNVQYRRAVDAMCAQEGRQAAERVSRLTAATAFELLRQLSPSYDPVKLRTALDFVTFGSELPEEDFGPL